ncbi:DUF3152 domain-containing protein [Streptomyces eurocidicus]|uniref:DUF3152 domain-containing protein n=1 Tax=Streptomyces eurocidicus TaxID=66423 RepID=A0A7W8BGC5_STREU|nr:DUF3152 domain-containing protein [Streptomyces eurocidicus]MBB5122931.1 hypothetical protein [Streptomyces eurocidicus]
MAVFLLLSWWVAWGPGHRALEIPRGTPHAEALPSPEPLPSRGATLADSFPADPKLSLRGGFTTVSGHDVPAIPRGNGRRLTYRVDVEDGLAERGFDAGLFASFVQRTLNDPRGWAHDGALSFERVSDGRADFAVTLASPGTVNTWCAKAGLDTSEQVVSCDVYGEERVMINSYRWALGAPTYGKDTLGYRRMLVNHEVGHRIGHDHETCGRSGTPAPVMMQQTKTLTTGTAVCLPNPWPYPERS